MSSGSSSSSNSSLATLNKYASKIDGVFKEHKKCLDDERQEAIEDIERWRHKLANRIQKQAEEQIKTVNEHYRRTQAVYEDRYRENLELADAYYDAKSSQLLDELYEACRALQFETMKLKYPKYDVSFAEVQIIKAQLKTKESSDVKEQKTENKIQNDDATDASSDATNSTTGQTDHEQSEARKRRRNGNQSKDIGDASKTPVEDVDVSTNKCPVCFMIFPSDMPSADRQQHVNEHYSGD